MQAVLTPVFGNVFVALFIVAICTTIAKFRRLRLERRPFNAAYVAWGELLVYSVGVNFIYAGLLHAYFQRLVAPTIGWTPSPFEYELGWIEIPVGIVAIVGLWRGFEFRLAATIVAVIFALAAAAQHVQQITCCANYAPGNAGLVLWLGDIFIPIALLVLAALSRAPEEPRRTRRY